MSSRVPYWTRLQVFEQDVTESVRAAWTEWLRRHGISADQVALPGWIAVDDELYRVYVDTFALNVLGDHYVDITSAGEAIARVVITVQLEGPALPFPDTRQECRG